MPRIEAATATGEEAAPQETGTAVLYGRRWENGNRTAGLVHFHMLSILDSIHKHGTRLAARCELQQHQQLYLCLQKTSVLSSWLGTGRNWGPLNKDPKQELEKWQKRWQKCLQLSMSRQNIVFRDRLEDGWRGGGFHQVETRHKKTSLNIWCLVEPNLTWRSDTIPMLTPAPQDSALPLTSQHLPSLSSVTLFILQTRLLKDYSVRMGSSCSSWFTTLFSAGRLRAGLAFIYLQCLAHK